MTVHLVTSPSAADSSDQQSTRRCLVGAAAAGDPAAWCEIVRRHERLVAGVAARYRLSPDQVADVVQTTWLRLFENIDGIRDPERLPGWLATTAAREALGVCRRSMREVALHDHYDPPDGTDDLDDRVSARERGRELHRAVTSLPTRERRLVEHLLAPDELTYREIGRRMGIPIGSIGPVRQRALRRLRTILEAQAPRRAPMVS
jgi:RNA polymerase sigma factor (sigma-70 family)